MIKIAEEIDDKMIESLLEEGKNIRVHKFEEILNIFEKLVSRWFSFWSCWNLQIKSKINIKAHK